MTRFERAISTSQMWRGTSSATPGYSVFAIIPRWGRKSKIFLSVVIPVVKAVFRPGLMTRRNPANARIARLSGLRLFWSWMVRPPLPKQARYQLRNTPASGGTAAPPEYSISFFARFVNTESAADGTARSAFFQPTEAAAGNSGKGRGRRCFLWEPGAGLVRLPKSGCKNYTECKTCCTLVASGPERCYHNTISPGSAAVGN